MSDDVEVHFDERFGSLRLNCSGETFARVLNAVLSEANIQAFELDGVFDAVESLEVYQSPPATSSPPTGVWDRVILIGCGMVGFVILFLLVIGLGTLAGWVR
jgi:hypothetical protein